ncbi:MAG: glucose/sorbosone family PQQ-dependent dehydrogenase [Bacteroidota bacterium]
MDFYRLSFVSCCLFLLFAWTHGSAQGETFTMTPLGVNNFLITPWDLHYGPDDQLWVTERSTGVISRVSPINGARDNLIQIQEMSSTAGQDGLLGIALHPDLLGNNPYVYLSYTYLVQGERRQRLVRYTYSIDNGDGSLSAPQILLENLPSSNDHNSGRLVVGPDDKLYYSIGDQGGNQNANFCNPILSQVLPTQAEIDQEDWTHYPGKILRLNLDGSIPTDNPLLAGVRSYIYSYGHRNPQGLAFGSNGFLYSDEHGPNTDDEVNRIVAGGNYGWPNVVGFQDDQAYDYCNWSSATDCENLNYANGGCPAGVTLEEESSFLDSAYREPMFSLFAVPDTYDFNAPGCQNSWICRPNVAPSSLAIYESEGIPGWDASLLVVSLKRGRIYRLKLDANGEVVQGDTLQYLYTRNRYRNLVVDPDGKTFYVITDQSGRTSSLDGLSALNDLQNPGNILKFTLDESTSNAAALDQNRIRMWPNPASQQISVEIPLDLSGPMEAELIGMNGTVVQTFSDLRPGIQELQLKQLPAGIYVFRLHANDQHWQQRLVWR